MSFSIILNQHTPVADKISNVDFFIMSNISKLQEFVRYFKAKPLLGLAANQMAYKGKRWNVKLFVMNINGEPVVAINPDIIEYIGNSEETNEGCHTWPHKTIVANRYDTIIVKFTTLNRHEQKIKLTGLSAHIFQHEFNHLCGFKETIKG